MVFGRSPAHVLELRKLIRDMISVSCDLSSVFIICFYIENRFYIEVLYRRFLYLNAVLRYYKLITECRY